MRRIFISLLLLCASTISLAQGSIAASVTVNGQIFVVTKSQQTVKLALVNVVAIPEKKIKALLEPSAKAMLQDLQVLAATIEQKKQDVARIKAALKNPDGSDISPFAEMEELSKVCKPTADVDAFLRCSRTPAGKAAFTRMKVLDEQYKTEVDQVKTLRGEIRKLMKDHRTATAALRFVPDAESFAEGAVDSTKTDADGKFGLAIPYGQNVAILANSKRAVADNTEHYQWVVWFTPKKGAKNLLFLANDNLLETSCMTCFQAPKVETYPDLIGYPEYIGAQ